MEDKQFEVLLNEIRGVSSAIERLSNDLGRDATRDRQEASDHSVALATITEGVRQMRKAVNTITGDVGDKVGDTLKPAVKEVVVATTSLKKEISKKKSIIITKNGIIDWFKGLLRSKGGEK